ncbi:hypothetical protein AT959_14740 [Dechloromonas denitrificans]|uniref:LysM domain-containing protein n=1 Tax=Dechloromonas denitrificans TaxID=281362 RepID=A0A133XI25_9RHOO|nr:LysM peptidoglycan-binding domain-containing protein [Dechloromonas denitrificans]KXB30578.1 hypothetical protein AT959_14740 [Dechloromonas denitrificans]
MTAETYTVQQGDTLGKIAAQHGVSVDEIAQTNHIRDRNKISVGQRFNIPKKNGKKQPSAQSEGEEWSETVMRFVDSIGRPIVGLAVRLVVAGNELRAKTDASGCISPMRCNNANETIEIHVEKAPARGGGEKQIASYAPRPGQQKIQVKSGMHVEKSALRSHEGTPERPPRKLPSTPLEPLETRTTGGNPLSCSVGCECPNDDDLKLGPNNIYRPWVKVAAQRAGLIPQAVAAVMNAEAAKDKAGKWKEDSKSPSSSATGMTQFLDGSWVAEAVRSGTYLNNKARKEAWLKQDEKGAWCFVKQDGTLVSGPGLDRKLMKLFTGKRSASDKNLQKLLNLRNEAEFAIMAAMDYARANLDSLSAKGYAISGLNDTEKARIMYLCHHLGLADATHFIQNDIPEEDVFAVDKNGNKRLKQNGAKKLLTTQLGGEGTEKWLKKASDNWIKAHRLWLEDFMNRALIPHIFACPGDKQEELKTDEKAGALTDITERLKK